MTLGALGGAVQPLTRAEVIKLAADSPVTTLPMLGRALGVSEPVIRQMARSGELDKLGIRCLRLGSQYRVPTADILRVLGIDPEPDSAGATVTVLKPALLPRAPGALHRDADARAGADRDDADHDADRHPQCRCRSWPRCKSCSLISAGAEWTMKR